MTAHNFQTVLLMPVMLIWEATESISYRMKEVAVKVELSYATASGGAGNRVQGRDDLEERGQRLEERHHTQA